MSDAMRESFEQQWYGYWASIGVEIGNVFQRDNDGDYVISAVEDAWQGWQLALELSQKEDCDNNPHAGRGVEPVAHMTLTGQFSMADERGVPPDDSGDWIPLYTHPPAPVVESANASSSQVCVPEGQHMMPTEFLREYLELLNESDFRAVHKMIRQNMIEAMLNTATGTPNDQ